MSVKFINELLYERDPVGTCCNRVPGMEDEYLTFAVFLQNEFCYGAYTKAIFTKDIADYFEVEPEDINYEDIDYIWEKLANKYS